MDKTKYLVGTFLATALLIGGCFSDEEKPAENTTTQNETNLAGERLTDDNGVEYTLIDNGDGTETARYDDGRSVTFRRQEDGSLDYLYGAAGLIAGMAAGYYLFHGFSSPAGNWNAAQNRYTVSEPLKRNDDKNTTAGGAGRVSNNSNTTNTTNTPNSSNATNSNSKVNLSKESTSSNSNAKTGFGSAGTRTPSTSAAS